MRKLAMGLLMVMAMTVSTYAATVEQTLNAIQQVESGGEPNGGRDAKGDKKHGVYRALGPMQIWEAYHEDACEQLRREGKADLIRRWKDVREIEYAQLIVKAYFRRYCRVAYDSGDARIMAKTHRGGPGGASDPRMEPYARKVLMALKGS